MSTPPSASLAPSVLALLAANLIPLYGVAFLGWQVFPVMLLFWLENVIIGWFTVARMLIASPGMPQAVLAKAAMIGFFGIHYGGFVGAHGVFVLALFSGLIGPAGNHTDLPSIREKVSSLDIGWAALALVASHAASFVFNYVGRGEYKTADLKDLMFQPYGRILVMHAVLIFGGIAVVFVGLPWFALVLLVVLKAALDVRAHVREHSPAATAKAPAQPAAV